MSTWDGATYTRAGQFEIDLDVGAARSADDSPLLDGAGDPVAAASYAITLFAADSEIYRDQVNTRLLLSYLLRALLLFE